MLRPARRPFAAGVVTAAALLAAVAGCTSAAPAPAPAPAPATAPPSAPATAPGRGDERRSGGAPLTYTLLQTNLCLSGLADCFAAAQYPNVVEEAVSRIQEAQPDAVSMNEACRSDAVRIARRTSYRMGFVPVHYAGGPLPCVAPGGRGLFGLAVLTREPIVRVESEPFLAQTDLEERRWLCVSSRDGVDVCTSHLEAPDSSDAEATNDAQCAELRVVLTRPSSRPTLFGGDVNRTSSCAPDGSWTRTDGASARFAGVQHVYGTFRFKSPVAKVLPSAFSDHDLLLVRARLVRSGD
jgi:endonuclease/exonuclease/phosphatase family metal-dependent hydrolase